MRGADLTLAVVTGIGRSGTSAFLAALAEHPAFLKPVHLGEAPFIGHFAEFLAGYEDGEVGRGYHLKAYKIAQPDRLAAFRDLMFRLHVVPARPEQLDDPAVAFWPAKAFPRSKSFAKFRDIYPRSPIFYLIRNGIEVVNSMRSYRSFAHMTFEQMCRRWSGSLVANAFLEQDPLTVLIRHEDLVSDPHTVLAAAFARTGVPWDPAPARFLANTLFNSSFAAGADAGPGAPAADALAPLKSRAEAWLDWTDEERAIFRSVCGNGMAAYGFDVPGSGGAAEPGGHAARAAPGGPQPRPFAPVTPVAAVAPASPRQAGRAVQASDLAVFMPAREINYCTHPSLARRVLYVETPKVACSTLKYAMQASEYLGRGETPPAYDQSEVHYRVRSPLPQFARMTPEQQAETLNHPEWTRFCFVRDPYARILSAYISKIERNVGPKRVILAALRGVPVADITDLSDPVSFRVFLELLRETRPYQMDIHWRPQVDQVFWGTLKYDFVGRFEALEQDFAALKAIAFPGLDVALPAPRNRSGAAGKTHRYYDEACRRLVQEIYAADFKAFGYPI